MSSAVIADDPSVPLILKFLSAVLTVSSTSVELLAISNIDVPSSLKVMLAPLASSIMSPSISSVKSPPSDIVLPFIVISSTVKVVSVPKEVIFDCAAPVTVAAVPDTFPVTSPVNGPAKASAVTVPSKNASLNSTELVPKSISLFVDGTIAPSVNVT